jgi:cytidine deaminase
MKSVEELLVETACQAKENAYAPYSQFKVGAALITGNKNIYKGCNIENAAYGLTMCAERTALYNAYVAGDVAIEMMVIIADTVDPVSPCGSCRQVLYELCPPDMKIILVGNGFIKKIVTVEELLPYGFTLKK